MFLHDGKHLVSHEADQPESSGGDRHAASADLSRINFRNDDPAGDTITEGMTGDKAHHKNQDGQTTPVDVIEPADQRERDELHSGTGQDQGLASSTVHQPERDESKQKIDEAHQHGLKKSVAGGSSGGAKNLRQEREQRRDSADLLQPREHDA